VLILPLQPVPSQTLNAFLNGQALSLNVYTLDTEDGGPPIFVDVYSAGQLIIGGVRGLVGVRIVRDSYLWGSAGTAGDFIFDDTTPDPDLGPQDPQYAGLGARWQMLFLFPGELSPLDV
jgi:hypothetical protein